MRKPAKPAKPHPKTSRRVGRAWKYLHVLHVADGRPTPSEGVQVRIRPLGISYFAEKKAHGGMHAAAEHARYMRDAFCRLGGLEVRDA